MKKVSALVKIGCVMCMIPLIIFYILIMGIFFAHVHDKNDHYIYFVCCLFAIILWLPINVYIRIFKGKSSNTVRILFGILALFIGLMPGLFIILGEYEDDRKNEVINY